MFLGREHLPAAACGKFAVPSVVCRCIKLPEGEQRTFQLPQTALPDAFDQRVERDSARAQQSPKIRVGNRGETIPDQSLLSFADAFGLVFSYPLIEL